MKKVMTVTAMVLALVMSTMAVALAGSGSKATGSGEWTNNAGDDFYAEFDAHEEVVVQNNIREAKGELFQQRLDGEGEFYVEVTEVRVGEDWACFAGETFDATGVFVGRNGQNRWTFVTDGGEPGAGTLQGAWNATTPSQCLTGGSARISEFTDGNVTIHAGKAHQE